MFAAHFRAAQLTRPRTDILKKQHAAFLAPQLLERITILNRQLGHALDRIAVIRGTLDELEAAAQAHPCGTPDPCATRSGFALKRLRGVAGH